MSEQQEFIIETVDTMLRSGLNLFKAYTVVLDKVFEIDIKNKRKRKLIYNSTKFKEYIKSISNAYKLDEDFVANYYIRFNEENKFSGNNIVVKNNVEQS